MFKNIHHIHQRKRIHEKAEQYPHPNKWINFLDNILLAAAIIGPLMNFPQIYKIYSEQIASGLSLISWSLYAICDIPWIIYGIVHKEKPIITAYILWFLTNTTVIVGILLYS